MKKLLLLVLLFSSNTFGQDLVRDWEFATSRALKGEKLYEMSVLDPGLSEIQLTATYQCLREAVKPVEILRKGKYIIFYTFDNNEEELMKFCFPLPIESLEAKGLSYSETEFIYKSK